jgi:hypothetical protein
MDRPLPPLPETIEAFLTLHDMAPVTFGRLAAKDPHFVRDIRGGRRVWPETDAKIRAFMAGHCAPVDQKQAA